MKFALVDEQRREAQPQLSGRCPGCIAPMVARCGEIKTWHWAHVGRRTCDPWWENETLWHREWKGQFPVEYQEIIHKAPSGEKHIADVKTFQGWVLEFQHSHLKPEERRARSAFYPKLVWVVDGMRRPRHKAQFFKSLNEMQPVNSNPQVRRVFLAWSSLLQEWVGNPAPVFFDFGEETLWCLLPTKPDMWISVVAVSRASFINLHQSSTGDAFVEYMNRLSSIIPGRFSPIRVQTALSAVPADGGRSRVHRSLQQHLVRMDRSRFRF